MNPNNHHKEEPGISSFQWLLLVLLVMVISGIGLSLYDASHPKTAAPGASSLRAIASAVEAGKIKSITVRGDLLIAYGPDGKLLSARKEPGLSAFETLQLLGVSPGALAGLAIEVEEPANLFDIVCTSLPILVFLMIYGLYFFSIRQRASGAGPLSTIGRSNPRVLAGASTAEARSEFPQVTFQDVAGVDSAKIELQEVVEFLKEPAKFIRLGARVPKGVLMAGPPGTGKTLLAKAVAGEAGVPFFSISGSEFVELYVGVGASRVRDLFARAREKSPAIIFVDEIDAVGRQRGARIASGNDEREQTLNQILVEMDGFGTDTRVIVIAATNRPDVLDPALLRPGRFDRKVVLDRPDVAGRQAILNVHTRGKPLAPDVSIADLARLTPGFVGADLENLVNEAAILAARRNLDRIGRPEFQEAMERIIAGPERKGSIISARERQVIAYHEAGHAVVMHHLPDGDPVHKVSIISRGMALGYTMPLPEGDRYLRTREAFEAEIVGLLGGRAAEEIIFEQVTTGAANDLERATRLARTTVTRYGFSSRLGLRTYGDEQENPYLGSLGAARDYSEPVAEAIDEEINRILDTAYQQAKEIITQKRSQLDRLAQALLEHETVDRAEFEALMA